MKTYINSQPWWASWWVEDEDSVALSILFSVKQYREEEKKKWKFSFAQINIKMQKFRWQ